MQLFTMAWWRGIQTGDTVRWLALVAGLVLAALAVAYLPWFWYAFLGAIPVWVAACDWAERRGRGAPPPGPDDAGLMPPPWAAYPSLPQTICSSAWKQGSGEWYIGVFREWWKAQPPEVWARVAAAYPEPQGWAGFYTGWGVIAELGAVVERET